MQKGFALPLILVIVLLIILVGGGGYYFYNQYKLNSVKDYTSCVKAGNPILEGDQWFGCKTPDGQIFYQEGYEKNLKSTVSEAISIDETANWKTYTSNRYGYSVNYPPDWQVKEYPNNGNGLSTEMDISISSNRENATPLSVAVLVSNNLFEEELLKKNGTPECLKPCTGSESYAVYENTNFAGVLANKSFNIFSDDNQAHTYIRFNYNQKSFTISWKNTDFEGNYDQVYDQIIKTFKLLQ